jgi:hypothetical protein
MLLTYTSILYFCLLWAVEPSNANIGSRADSVHAEKLCAKYGALYSNIDEDLARWRQAGGISLDLMRRTVKRHTAHMGRDLTPYQRGFLVGFRGGRAFLIEQIDLKQIGHHAVGIS